MAESLRLAREGQNKTIEAIAKATIADENFRWRIILGSAIFLGLAAFVPPVRMAYVGFVKVAGAVVEETDRLIDFGTGGSSLDKSTLSVGDKINGARGLNLTRPTYQVTSTYGPRDTGIPGASKYHKGADVGTPIGTKQYVPFNVQTEITCKDQRNASGKLSGAGHYAELSFTYKGEPWQVRSFHLKQGSCTPGIMSGGQVFAQSGDTGVGSGPHSHIEVIINGQHINPYRGVVEAVLSGDPISGEK
jgi:murein DD-endopeptidase MepM/ murein hydrolase activator NlpD